jgi:hypothetical protein
MTKAFFSKDDCPPGGFDSLESGSGASNLPPFFLLPEAESRV